MSTVVAYLHPGRVCVDGEWLECLPCGPHTPRFVVDDRRVYPEPVSVLDLLWEAETGAAVGWGLHVVPLHDAKLPMGGFSNPKALGFSKMSSNDLHALYNMNRRGRPSAVLLETARTCFRDYWDGKRTIVQLCHDFGVANNTVARIVHKETYWYV